ncbi:radical SAM protein [Candidatus Bipolaricaulota bacterium]
MRIVESTGRDDVAMVYVADIGQGRLIEFVESLQPPIPPEEKWVLIVSVLLGCPIGCPICDAGGHYSGKLSKDEIIGQIDYLIRKRFPSGEVPVEKFKIQFARMGEPALNSAVLDVLEALPAKYHVPGLLPSISTIAPRGTDPFFERLLAIKNDHYGGGRFQLQFSIHSTDLASRSRLIPAAKWGFDEIAAYGKRFRAPDDRKIALNFALADGVPIDAATLARQFPVEDFLVKVTPLNPTHRAAENGLHSHVDAMDPEKEYESLLAIKNAGFEVILSIGEVEENQIGSNCGQYVERHLRAVEAGKAATADGYTYWRAD